MNLREIFLQKWIGPFCVRYEQNYLVALAGDDVGPNRNVDKVAALYQEYAAALYAANMVDELDSTIPTFDIELPAANNVHLDCVIDAFFQMMCDPDNAIVGQWAIKTSHKIIQEEHYIRGGGVKYKIPAIVEDTLIVRFTDKNSAIHTRLRIS